MKLFLCLIHRLKASDFLFAMILQGAHSSFFTVLIFFVPQCLHIGIFSRLDMVGFWRLSVDEFNYNEICDELLFIYCTEQAKSFDIFLR